MRNGKVKSGAASVELLFASRAQGPEMPNWLHDPEKDNRYGIYGPRLKMHRADQIDDADLEYLLPDTLLQGCPQVIVGRPGVGKSTLLAAMAATISNVDREIWAGKSGVKHGAVVVYNSEDSNSVLKMRLAGAGADLSNIQIIGTYRRSLGQKAETFSMKEHGEELKSQLQRIPNVVAIFFDNISGLLNGFGRTYLGVREAFDYIKSIVPTNCAIVALTHFRKDYDGKNPLDSILGSSAISQVVRSVLVAKRVEGEFSPDSSPLYALVREKVSNGKAPGSGTYYSIEEIALSETRMTTRVVWHEDFLQLEAPSEANKQVQFPKKQITLAIRFINGQLAAGPIPVRTLQELARGEGISCRTLERARDVLGISPFKSGVDGKWWLGPPGTTREDVERAATGAAAFDAGRSLTSDE